MMIVLFVVSVDSFVFLISVVLVVYVGGRIPLGLLGLLAAWCFWGLIFNCCCCDLWIGGVPWLDCLRWCLCVWYCCVCCLWWVGVSLVSGFPGLLVAMVLSCWMAVVSVMWLALWCVVDVAILVCVWVVI